MINPLVSIIIPTYNRAHLIGETLDSVLAQTYENWECIIVDDGSTDNTDEVIDDYVRKNPRIKYHKRPEDRPHGGNAARNYGFELSKGEFINWFDDDDIMLEDFILKKINLFSNEKIQMVICSSKYVDNYLKTIEVINLEINSSLYKEFVLWNLKITTNSVLFRKSFLKDKALFNLKILRGQEGEFFSRLFFKIDINEYLILNQPLYLYRQHLNTKSSQNLTYIKTFKSSQTFIAIENFNRSIELKDFELINYYYKAVINYFFLALSNQHVENTDYILSKFTPNLRKVNYVLSTKFKVVASFLCFIGRNSYRIEKYFKTQKIK